MSSSSKLCPTHFSRCFALPTSPVVTGLVISNPMVYHNLLETNLLKLFETAENSEWFSIISDISFEVTSVVEGSLSLLSPLSALGSLLVGNTFRCNDV